MGFNSGFKGLILIILIIGQTVPSQAVGTLGFQITTGGFSKNLWLQEPKEAEVLRKKNIHFYTLT